MSVTDTMPFIKQVLNACEEKDLQDLYDFVNGVKNDETTFRTLLPGSTLTLSDKDAGVKKIYLELSGYVAQKVLYGYLIYNDSYKVFIAFSGKDAQQLQLVRLFVNSANQNWGYEFLNDNELSITDLRNELNFKLISIGKVAKIQADDIDSGEEASGKILTTDGNGGAVWFNPVLFDGEEYYIEIGSTRLTESQLQDLLALLTPSNETTEETEEK